MQPKPSPNLTRSWVRAPAPAGSARGVWPFSLRPDSLVRPPEALLNASSRLKGAGLSLVKRPEKFAQDIWVHESDGRQEDKNRDKRSCPEERGLTRRWQGVRRGDDLLASLFRGESLAGSTRCLEADGG